MDTRFVETLLVLAEVKLAGKTCDLHFENAAFFLR